jgi:ribosomal protein S18 acetylase RimI-like enzyme
VNLPKISQIGEVRHLEYASHVRTRQLPDDVLRAELRRVLEAFSKTGFAEVAIRFGFAWHRKVGEGKWGYVRLPITQVLDRVLAEEEAGHGCIGDDELFVRHPVYNCELVWSHEAGIELRFYEANPFLIEIYDAWSALGFEPGLYELVDRQWIQRDLHYFFRRRLVHTLTHLLLREHSAANPRQTRILQTKAQIFLSIRARTPDDAAGIAEVEASATATLRRVYRPNAAAQVNIEGIAHSLNALVAVGEGRIVGTVQFRVEGDALQFVGLGVLDLYRGRGVARALVEAGVLIARDQGLSAVVARTVEETGNVGFFEHCGFVVVSRRPDSFAVGVDGREVTDVELVRVVS